MAWHVFGRQYISVGLFALFHYPFADALKFAAPLSSLYISNSSENPKAPKTPHLILYRFKCVYLDIYHVYSIIIHLILYSCIPHVIMRQLLPIPMPSLCVCILCVYWLLPAQCGAVWWRARRYTKQAPTDAFK